MNYTEFVPKSELGDFIAHTNHIFKNKVDYVIERVINYSNHFDIDTFFYINANKLNISKIDDIYGHIYCTGIFEGLLYHPKQLVNIFPKIKIYESNNELYVKYKNKYIELNNFLNNKLYKKPFDWYINRLKCKKNKLQNNKLFLLIFIGNENVGTMLLNKIIDVKDNDFGLAICFKTSKLYTTFKDIVKNNFTNYGLFISTEYGNDIIPTIMMFNYLDNKIKLHNIIKLHTKSSDESWFNESINFLLDNINLLCNYVYDNCNCIGNYKYLKNYDIYNMNLELINRYSSKINKKKFITGSNFYCNKSVFNEIINIVKDDYKMFFNNNMYDTNEILYDRSPIHTLERLFGIIKLNSDSKDISCNIFNIIQKYNLEAKNINFNFDYLFYVNFYEDVTNYSSYQALRHYKKQTLTEQRIPNLYILLDLYNLKTINILEFNELKQKKESIISLLKKKFRDFDYQFYMELYKNDFKNTRLDSYEKGLLHYYTIGRYQNRICNNNEIIQNKIKFNDIIVKDKIEQLNLVTNNKNKFSILIRTNKRPTKFNNLYNSIRSQNYSNELINLFVSYHNDVTYNYLQKYSDIIPIKVEETLIKEDCNNPYPYNIYLNDLIKNIIDDSWIIFIDDDDLFINEYSIYSINYEIERIRKKIQNDDFALFWRVVRCDQLLGEICYNKPNLNLQILPLCGFSIHSKNANLLKFNTDKVALQINKLSEKIDIHWTKYILTKIGQENTIAGFNFAEL